MDRIAAARAIDAFLLALGRDPSTEPELRGTGDRVAEAFADELCAGYAVDVDALLRGNILDGGAHPSSGVCDVPPAAHPSSGVCDVPPAADPSTLHTVVELRDVALTTTCPHHLMAGTGKATLAFAPKGKILGVGSMARLLDAFARRLTLQETIGQGVVSAIHRNLSPRWVACRIEMTHACMTARGERTHGARLVTYAMHGDDDAAREDAARFVRGASET